MDMLLLLASVIVSVSSPDGSKAIELRSDPLSVAVTCGGFMRQ